MTPFGYRVLGFGSGEKVILPYYDIEYLMIGGGASGGQSSNSIYQGGAGGGDRALAGILAR